MRASQPWRFFCVITPGLEELAAQEFLAKRSMLGADDLTPTMVPGGMEFTLPWEIGRGLTHVLKLPTRVIVRLTEVTARDFPKLFQKAQTLPWTQWLANPEPMFKISAHECRLMHTGRIEETLQDALKAAHKKQPFSSRYLKESIAPETLYVRGVKDQWTISLDITGTALYKRGVSDIKGVAPLRETFAAACLRTLFQEPHPTSVTLWDPFCGSGTFLFEARDHFSPTERNLSYEKSVLNLGVSPWKPKSLLPAWPIREFLGSDLNEELIEKLAGQKLRFFKQDALQGLAPAHQGELWIVANPPYGERIELPEGVTEFAKKLSHSLSKTPARRTLLLVPASWPPMLINQQKPRSILRFSNGGLPVEGRLWVF